jgi:hypothetical protein
MRFVSHWFAAGFFLATAMVCCGGAEPTATQAKGPLRVHPTNPRYFTDGTRLADGSAKAVYLTGSHTWANLIDRGPSDPPPAFAFAWYLDFLGKHHHNFIRLWTRHVSWYQRYGEKELHAAPLAWQRTGPGKALDGKSKFDLMQFEPAYFERLRSRVEAARDRGIYVSIMLFGGYQETGPNWTGNPFHRENNINGIDGDANKDGDGAETQTLEKIPNGVAEVQKRYVRKVVDTLNDLDNVLFEISNESGGHSRDWQYDLIRFIERYEKTKPEQHPVGMTIADWPPAENRLHLDASPATWVSYYFQAKPPKGQEEFGVNDPFVADGGKVSIQDSDHWWVEAIRGDAAFGRGWVWKSFCRGHNPILMEHLPPLSAVLKDLPFAPDDPGYVASRRALGHTRHFAERMNLGAMTPSREVASTKYCLANSGREYLVYQPDNGPFEVALTQSVFSVEWFNPADGKSEHGDPVQAPRAKVRFIPPWVSAAVLYLKRMEK